MHIRLPFRAAIVLVLTAIAALVPSGRGASAVEPGKTTLPPRDIRAETNRDHGKDVFRVGATNTIPPGEVFRQTMVATDADAIVKVCVDVAAAAPTFRAFHQEATFGDKKAHPDLVWGTNEQYLLVRDWQHLKAGQNFTEKNVRNGDAVCLLGQTVAAALFGDQSPVGQEINFKGSRFRVVGLLEAKGREGHGFDMDSVIIIPWTALDKLPDVKKPEFMEAVWVKAKSTEKMPAAAAEIEKTLRQQHHLKTPRNDFDVVDLVTEAEAEAKAAEELLRRGGK